MLAPQTVIREPAEAWDPRCAFYETVNQGRYLPMAVTRDFNTKTGNSGLNSSSILASRLDFCGELRCLNICETGETERGPNSGPDWLELLFLDIHHRQGISYPKRALVYRTI